MLNWLRNFQLEKISFLLGFISATILWFLAIKGKKWVPQIKTETKKVLRSWNQSQTRGVSTALKKETLARVQKNHLAKDIFSLDDVLIEPLFYSKPKLTQDSENPFDENPYSLFPFTPYGSFLYRNLDVPKIKITEAIQNKANLVIVGLPGLGKSVALSHLTSSIIRQDPDCGDQINKTPFFIHVLETDALENFDQDLKDVLFKVFSARISAPYIPRLAKYINNELSLNNAILILDGLDELTRDKFNNAVQFIRKVTEAYPDIQIILTATPLYLGDLTKIGFTSIHLLAWSEKDLDIFFERWTNLWYERINQELKFPELLLSNWIKKNKQPLTPLEYTMLSWSALSGNLRGTSSPSIYDSFLHNFISDQDEMDVLIDTAKQLLNEQSLVKKTDKYKNTPLQILFSTPIFRLLPGGKFSFSHIDFMSYLANLKTTIIDEMGFDSFAWPANFSAAGFSLLQGNTASQDLLNQAVEEKPTYINLILMGNWLRHIPQKSEFRNHLLSAYARIIQDNKAIFGIKMHCLSGFAMANDPSTAPFLRQLLSGDNLEQKKIAILGMAVTKMTSVYLKDLLNIVNNQDSDIQILACKVLSRYPDEEALQVLGKLLLSGNENIRQIVAESIAQNNPEAKDILVDALSMDDILVRRAAIFGLVKINELWVFDHLEKASFEDSQWVVRNTAAQALEYLQSKKPSIPDKTPHYYDDPWLITYASNHNLGLSPEYSPLEILFTALNLGSQEDKIQALRMLIRYPGKETIEKIYEVYYRENDVVKENALSSLIEIYSSGHELPHPAQFGFVD